MSYRINDVLAGACQNQTFAWEVWSDLESAQVVLCPAHWQRTSESLQWYSYLSPPNGIVTYLKEALAVLQDEDAAVGEVWLLRHPGAAPLDGVLVKPAVALDLGVVLALQVVAEGRRHARTAPRRQGVEDQDARPKERELHIGNFWET